MATKLKVQCTQLNVWEAFEALGVLAGEGWAEPNLAIRIGRTFRRVRKVRDLIEEDRQELVDKYGKKDEDGVYVRDVTGSIALKDSVAFNREWRTLLEEDVDGGIEVFPVAASELAQGKQKKGKCKECERPAGPALSPYHLETLVTLGFITGLEEDVKADEEIEGE